MCRYKRVLRAWMQPAPRIRWIHLLGLNRVTRIRWIQLLAFNRVPSSGFKRTLLRPIYEAPNLHTSLRRISLWPVERKAHTRNLRRGNRGKCMRRVFQERTIVKYIRSLH